MYKSLNEQANIRITKEMKNKTPKRVIREEQLGKAERVGMGRKKLRCALPGTVMALPHPPGTKLMLAYWMAELAPFFPFFPSFIFSLPIFK